jgi:hypothetical protein
MLAPFANFKTEAQGRGTPERTKTVFIKFEIKLNFHLTKKGQNCCTLTHKISRIQEMKSGSLFHRRSSLVCMYSGLEEGSNKSSCLLHLFSLDRGWNLKVLANAWTKEV